MKQKLEEPFEEFCRTFGFSFRPGAPLANYIIDSPKGSFLVTIGEGYHHTRKDERRTMREDRLLTRQGHRVLRVDKELIAIEGYWPFIFKKVGAFMLSSQPSAWIT